MTLVGVVAVEAGEGGERPRADERARRRHEVDDCGRPRGGRVGLDEAAVLYRPAAHAHEAGRRRPPGRRARSRRRGQRPGVDDGPAAAVLHRDQPAAAGVAARVDPVAEHGGVRCHRGARRHRVQRVRPRHRKPPARLLPVRGHDEVVEARPLELARALEIERLRGRRSGPDQRKEEDEGQDRSAPHVHPERLAGRRVASFPLPVCSRLDGGRLLRLLRALARRGGAARAARRGARLRGVLRHPHRRARVADAADRLRLGHRRASASAPASCRSTRARPATMAQTAATHRRVLARAAAARARRLAPARGRGLARAVDRQARRRRCASTSTIVRAILRGEDPPPGEKWSTGFRLAGVDSRPDLPIYIAALSPRDAARSPARSPTACCCGCATPTTSATSSCPR